MFFTLILYFFRREVFLLFIRTLYLFRGGFFVVYTDGIFLPWGISPLRSVKTITPVEMTFIFCQSGRTRAFVPYKIGRNDIIKQADKKPSPEGEGLRLRARCHFERRRSRSREIPYNRDGNSRIRYAAGRGRPALPTATPRIGHNVISSVSQEVSLREKRNFTHSRQPTRQRGLRAEKAPATEMKAIIHPLPQTLASRGSLPRQPTRLRWLCALQ